MKKAAIDTLGNLASLAWPKWLVALIGAIAAYIFPTEGLIVEFAATAALIGIDTITGIIASITEQKPVTSNGFVRVLGKLIGYASVVCVVSILFRYIPGLTDWRIPAITAVMVLVMMTEGISIIENAKRLGIRVPNWIGETIQHHFDPDQKPKEATD